MASIDPNSDLGIWLDRIRLSMPHTLHARLSEVEIRQARTELLIERLIDQVESLEIIVSEAVNALWQQVADMVGVIKAEYASLKGQLDAALADQEAAKGAAVEAALGAEAAADAARLEGLLSDLSSMITTTPEIPAEVPEVPVPDPGEPAEEPHPDNTLPGDLPS